MSIGEIPGVQLGASFASRRELYDAGVHRALQTGIVGSASNGAESIVLSGGYVDDQDLGDEIIYTGRGGRDPQSRRQIADQAFGGQNQALVTSCLQGLPVRVVRARIMTRLIRRIRAIDMKDSIGLRATGMSGGLMGS
jgi:putative restriction endonuclease